MFAVSNLPMLAKAVRTREMNSYSLGYLLLGNAANAVHSVYVFTLPMGPIWLLHSFYVVAMALMLVLYLRFTAAGRRNGHAEVHGSGAEVEQALAAVTLNR